MRCCITDELLQFSIGGFPFHLNIYQQCVLARLVSLCQLLSLSIYTCYPVTQINSVNKYAASKVSLLYSMVFFCLSVTHSLVNSFANAFFKYNVPRRRQAEIAFPTLCDHFLRRLGFRNDAWRRCVLVRLRAKNKCCLLGPRTRRSRNKPDGLGQEKKPDVLAPVRAGAPRQNGSRSKKNRQRAA